MNWLLIRVDIVRECLVVVLFGKGDFVGNWVVSDFDDVAGSKREWLELAVILHLIAIPGIAIRTDEVVPVVGSRVAKVVVDFLHFI